MTPTGQSTIVEYTGRNRILDRMDMGAALDYRWYAKADGPRPGATLGVRVAYAGRMQTTTLYPTWRKHATWSLILDAGLSALAGFGSPMLDGSYDAGASTSLKSFNYYLDRHYEYKTLPRAGASLGFTAARRFGAGFEAYLRVSDAFTMLLATPQALPGRSRNLACITLGCNF